MTETELLHCLADRIESKECGLVTERERQIIADALRAYTRVPPSTVGVEANLAEIQMAADSVVQRVCEWTDRTSPEDFPEALLITPSELHQELVQFATDIGALDPASLIAKGEGK